jgi:hypothetical protein
VSITLTLFPKWFAMYTFEESPNNPLTERQDNNRVKPNLWTKFMHFLLRDFF